MSKQILSVESLTIESKGIKYIKNLSMELLEGVSYIFLGEMGSGKTVLCNAIASNLSSKYRVVSGDIFYKEESILSLSENEYRKIAGSEISILSPEMRFHPYTEVGKQIEDILSSHNLLKKTKKEIIPFLEKIGFTKKILSQYPYKMEELDLKKLMFLITLLLSPNISMFIHSFRGFDSEIERFFINLILEKVKIEKMTPIFVTHDLSFADRYGEYIFLFKDSEIVEHGDKKSIFDNPQNSYTKLFLESTPYFKIKYPKK